MSQRTATPNTNKIDLSDLIALVELSDQTALRMAELSKKGSFSGTQMSDLRTEMDRIDMQLNRLLGDTSKDRRTAVWRARKLIADGQP